MSEEEPPDIPNEHGPSAADPSAPGPSADDREATGTAHGAGADEELNWRVPELRALPGGLLDGEAGQDPEHVEAREGMGAHGGPGAVGSSRLELAPVSVLDRERPGEPRPPLPPRPTRGRTRLKRLRLLAILVAALLLGIVSFAFGMFMSVASELPSLEQAVRKPQFEGAANSTLLDQNGHMIGLLSDQNRYLLTQSEIPPVVKDAVIAIEDKRFRSNSGIDLRGIARAFVQDLLHSGAVQGASTIEQQFVKLALQAQAHRTILEKLREAALAYHLAHEWTKEKIITEYLNTIYFGNGAYGIESAARTYFPQDGCGTPHNLCVSHLTYYQAALLAGLIQSPSGYDPAEHPEEARDRRDTVLQQMRQQGYITRAQYRKGIAEPIPSRDHIQAPKQMSVKGYDVGYFTSWVGQQILERYGAARAYDGGLRIKTTLNLGLQGAAERAIDNWLPLSEDPTASLVAIENSTGKVRAMVGGRNYEKEPFNIATQGERQPGSSFKAFDLAAALEEGISPDSLWSSHVKVFHVPRCQETFVVHNDEGAYAGERTLTDALAYSDNTVFAELGLKVGTKRIARVAHRMGITTPISTNCAMTIGGLNVGVTPIDMAHAYETIAHDGDRVTGTLADPGGPVGIESVKAPTGKLMPNGHPSEVDHVRLHRVMPATVAQTETSMLETVLEYGTAKDAALGRFAAGKTGTTSNYVDAWFVGWDSRYTVAVWVGYPNKLVPMTTQFDGQPVVGGSFPALIWHDFMVAAQSLAEAESGHRAPHGESQLQTEPPEGIVESSTTEAPVTEAPVGSPREQPVPEEGEEAQAPPATAEEEEEETAAPVREPVEEEAPPPEEPVEEEAPPPEATTPPAAAPTEEQVGGAAAPTGGAAPE